MASSEIKKISDENQLTGHGFEVVKIGASFCENCVEYQPAFQTLAEKFSQAKFYQADVEDVRISPVYDVDEIPCTMIYKNGLKISEIIGFDQGTIRTIEQFLL